MNKMLFVSALFFVVAGISRVYAQDEFEEVKVLDHPRYSLTNRISLDVDAVLLPLDAYYKPMMVEGALSYQPVDWFSWEFARVGYSLLNYDTGLEGTVNGLLASEGVHKGISDTGLKLMDMRMHLSSTAFFNLLYSKSNFFNTRVVYYYWQVGAGYSYYDMDQFSQMGGDLVIRVRFFLNEHWSFNIRGGHSFGFTEDAPKNITFLGLGVGFAL